MAFFRQFGGFRETNQWWMCLSGEDAAFLLSAYGLLFLRSSPFQGNPFFLEFKRDSIDFLPGRIEKGALACSLLMKIIIKQILLLLPTPHFSPSYIYTNILFLFRNIVNR